jgi:hypothetical protein
MVDSHAFICPGSGQLASVLASTESLVASTRQLKYSRKYFPAGSPLRPLISLCILVLTLKKSASLLSMATADAIESTAGSESSHEKRMVVY